MDTTLKLACLAGLFQVLTNAQTSGASDRAAPAPATVTSRPSPTPPTPPDRLHDYLRSWVDPVSLVSAGVSADGSAYAQHMVYSTLLLGTSSLCGDDNRYFASGRTGFGSRLWQPESTRSYRTGMMSFAVEIGVSGGFNVGREFIPGIPR